MRRPSAHIEHPASPGTTLCGKPPCSIVPCPECFSRWEAMTRVHVQSTRRPDLAFCGAPLQGPRIVSVQIGEVEEAVLRRARGARVTPVAYVTQANARRILRGGDGQTIPLHQACVLNLGRFLGRLGAADPDELRGMGRPGPGSRSESDEEDD